MYAKLVTWQLAPDIQGEAAYEAFLADLSARNVPVLRRYGLLDGFVIRIAVDKIMTMNIYESEQDAETAWREVITSVGDRLDGKLKILERQVGDVVDLPMLLKET